MWIWVAVRETIQHPCVLQVMSDNPVADQDWEEAEFRARVLAELPEQLTEGDVEWAMRQLDVSRATVFRLAKQFRDDARTSALLPNSSGPKPGMQPMEPAIEAIVAHHFKAFYATRRKPTKTRSWREVAADCKVKGLAPPSIRRLGRWRDLKDQAKLMARREGKDKAERHHLATPGKLTAARPLDIVQIDHTKADVTVVDPVTRRPLGRPTPTVAIDVNSRMVLGFHLSLEPPSLLSVALCLTHAVMDKSHWLAARGIIRTGPPMVSPGRSTWTTARNSMPALSSAPVPNTRSICSIDHPARHATVAISSG